MEIRFGTDGWRGRMGKDFSFANVKLVCQAYANYLKKAVRSKDILVLVSHDTRYLSREYAQQAATILTLNRIKVHLTERDVPVPVLSFAVARQQLHGGICFTASYNELVFNGMKILDSRGAPLLPSRTALIENEVSKLTDGFYSPPRYPDSRYFLEMDLKTPYLDLLSEWVDFAKIRRSGIHLIVDNLYGTSRDYLDKILADHQIPVFTIHNYSDSHFGGLLPSCSQDNLSELARLVVEKKADAGLATDIDGDRFGIIDNRGRFVDSNTILPPLLEYLITIRKMQGDIVKSITTTNQIARVAAHYLRNVYETPVGFKYVADMLISRKAFIGVESTNGAALKGICPMKDGILFNLLIAEMMAHYRSPVHEIMAAFYSRFPRMFQSEARIAATPVHLEAYGRVIEKKNLAFPGKKIQKVQKLDGIKVVFSDHSWLVIRESGTTPGIRLYAEAAKAAEAKRLVNLGRKLLE